MAAERRRTVLVTGGASGIGRAVVEAFAAEGCATVSLDLQPCDAADASVTGDVREPDAHARAVAAALELTGGLDVLVPNAGIHDGGLDLTADPDELLARMRTVLDVDVIGYVLAMRAAAEPLRAARGAIVLTLSDASFLVGQTGAGVAYTAAKHAGLGLVGWAARAFAPEVRVNGVAPGGVATELRTVPGADDPGRPVFADAEAELALIATRNPLGLVLRPEEVARYYVLLASPAHRGMTGQVLRPDGGIAVR
jgi:2,3-dihydroxy-2,3-dihydrophenylpropionate dehydrogenase